MKPVSDLTYKMIAIPELPLVNTDESVDWAIEMIELGYESPSLFMLASFSKPTNYFEILRYIKDSVNELGFEFKTGRNAILSYATYYIRKIAKGHNVRVNLGKISGFCADCDMDDFIFDFCLLSWAWGDIDYGNIEFNHIGPTLMQVI